MNVAVYDNCLKCTELYCSCQNAIVPVNIIEFNNHIIHTVGGNVTIKSNIKPDTTFSTYCEHIISAFDKIPISDIIFVGKRLKMSVPVVSWVVGYVSQSGYKTISFNVESITAHTFVNKILESIIQKAISINNFNIQCEYNIKIKYDYHIEFNNKYHLNIINQHLLNAYIHDVMNDFDGRMSCPTGDLSDVTYHNDAYIHIIEYPMFLALYSFYMYDNNELKDDAFDLALITVENHYKLTNHNAEWIKSWSNVIYEHKNM